MNQTPEEKFKEAVELFIYEQRVPLNAIKGYAELLKVYLEQIKSLTQSSESLASVLKTDIPLEMSLEWIDIIIERSSYLTTLNYEWFHPKDEDKPSHDE